MNSREVAIVVQHGQALHNGDGSDHHVGQRNRTMQPRLDQSVHDLDRDGLGACCRGGTEQQDEELCP